MTEEERKQYNKEYYEKNKEYHKKYGKKYREKNKEQIKERMNKYNEKNKERVSKRQKEYYEKNKEKIAENGKKYYEKNKEKLKQYQKEYHKKQTAGVYKITNTKTDMIYIGQTAQFKKRQTDHKSRLRKKKHTNIQLQEDYNTYGEEAFVFEVIEELPCDTSPDVLLKKEAEQIKKHLREGKDIYNSLN